MEEQKPRARQRDGGVRTRRLSPDIQHVVTQLHGELDALMDRCERIATPKLMRRLREVEERFTQVERVVTVLKNSAESTTHALNAYKAAADIISRLKISPEEIAGAVRFSKKVERLGTFLNDEDET